MTYEEALDKIAQKCVHFNSESRFYKNWEEYYEEYSLNFTKPLVESMTEAATLWNTELQKEVESLKKQLEGWHKWYVSEFGLDQQTPHF
jgi:hypothetical protein